MTLRAPRQILQNSQNGSGPLKCLSVSFPEFPSSTDEIDRTRRRRTWRDEHSDSEQGALSTSQPIAKGKLRYLATNKMVDHKVILESSLHTDAAKTWRISWVFQSRSEFRVRVYKT